MEHMRISGNDPKPDTVISNMRSDAQKCQKQVTTKRDGVINPQYYKSMNLKTWKIGYSQNTTNQPKLTVELGKPPFLLSNFVTNKIFMGDFNWN